MPNENLRDENMLKSCPFCGNGELSKYYSFVIFMHIVLCRKCGCEGPQAKKERHAEELWNKRYVEVKNVKSQ